MPTIDLQLTSLRAMLKKLMYLVSTLLLIATIGYCAFYLLHDQTYLSDLFVNLEPCFYNKSKWPEFFNAEVKHQGDIFCWLGIVLSFVSSFFVLRSLKKNGLKSKTYTLQIQGADIIIGISLSMMCIGLWWWGNALLKPSFDEVFSAVNCANAHPFQTVAYYMLPNNHILFNLLNNVVFSGVEDKLVTGRLISLFAYIGIVLVGYYWLVKQFKNRILAVAACLCLVTQFYIWGFSMQARGYELYALMHLLAFISLGYYLKNRSRNWSLLNALSCATGFTLIPTFLYFYVAQMVFMFLVQARDKRIDLPFYKYHFFGLVFVFIMYLPALSFSGIQAVLKNRYVSVGDTSLKEFFSTSLKGMAKSYFSFCFADPEEKSWIPLVLAFVPAFLLFMKKKEEKYMGLFYIIMWVCLWLVMVVMKKITFQRCMNGYYCITILLLVIMIGKAVMYMADKWKLNKMKYVVLIPSFLLLSGCFLVNGKKHLALFLYWHDNNETYAALSPTIDKLDAGGIIGFSDESFYMYYLCTKRGLQAHKCLQGNEDLYIKNNSEALPESVSTFSLVQMAGEYEIYKRP